MTCCTTRCDCPPFITELKAKGYALDRTTDRVTEEDGRQRYAEIWKNADGDEHAIKVEVFPAGMEVPPPF